MCGIIACLANNCQECQSTIVSGINKLQNRGNDSYGIGTVRDGQFHLAKIANPEKRSFRELIETDLTYFSVGTTGLAHCRWATHGANTDLNAHPHLDHSRRFMLVHNGTIDNYLELREFLLQRGVTFQSDTDTEVIVNLIGYHYGTRDASVPPEERIRESIEATIEQLKGIWACVVISTETPETLWAFHYFCPLLVAWNEETRHVVIASERTGFGSQVTHCSKLPERVVYSITRESIPRIEVESVDHSTSDRDDPSPFRHWMIREIHEQGNCLLHLINQRVNRERICFPELAPHLKKMVKAQHVILIGCGTSYYAGKYSRHFLQELDMYSTIQCIDASEFDMSYLPTLGSSYCVLLSQSGETMDLIRVQQQLNDAGIFNLAIINVPKSTIQRQAGASILMEAGIEVAVASTKSYSCQIVAMKLVSLWLEQEVGVDIKSKFKPLTDIARQVEEVIDTYSNKLERWSQRLSVCRHLFILGKKNGYSLAKEASLKLKEVGYLHAESYSSSALKHGPYSLIEPGNPIVFILSRDDATDAIHNTIAEVRSRGALTWVITDWEDAPVADDTIQLPYNGELYGILHIVPFQLLSYYIAMNKGHNPDYPRNLAKSVTVD
jgi:glucosamine--fructose-6-phosphate aminotransferase (isomerizing)